MVKQLDFLTRRYSELEGLKQNWMSHWQEIVDYQMPYRQGMITKVTPGSKTMGRIFDSSPIFSQFLFAAGLHTMMTNPSAKWFSLGMKEKEFNEVPEVKRWLWEVENVMFSYLNDSNFTAQVNEAYLDYGGFGMFVMFLGEDLEDLVWFNKLDLGEVVIGEDSKGRVDTFMRRWQWSARQVVQEFGYDNVSSQVRTAFDKTPEKPFQIQHSIYPRQEYRDSSRLASQMPIASVYFEVQGKHLLSNSGYREFPILAPRFSVVTGEVYGRGPGMIALPDNKQLQQMEEDTIRAAQKKIDPPIMYARNSFTGPIRFAAGGTTIVRGTSVVDKMAPFPVAGDLGYGEEKAQQKRESIGRIFYNDMLQLVRQDRMTAMEVMARSEEKWRLMGPMLGRLTYEFLKPKVTRLFGILYRKGVLPPPPPYLQGRQWTAKFVSPLAKAQQLQEAQGIGRTLEIMLPVMQIQPTVADNWDWDQVWRIVADANSVPAVINKDPKLVAAERQARAEREKQMQEMAMANETMKAAGPLLAGNPGENAPLTAIMDTLKGTAQNTVAPMEETV